MTTKRETIIEWADDISVVAMDASGGNEVVAVRLICNGINEHIGDEIADELLEYWDSPTHALMASAHKAAVKRWNKENI